MLSTPAADLGRLDILLDLDSLTKTAAHSAGASDARAVPDLAPAAGVSTWLNHFELVLPLGSRFLVQSGGG